MALSRVLRSIARPLAATLSPPPSLSLLSKASSTPLPPFDLARGGFAPTIGKVLNTARFCSTATIGSSFGSLTDTRFPKRRPGTKPRRKRASLRPPGPYAWVQYVPGEEIPRSRPNEGSIKARGRKRKKRIMQRKAFILSEKKKRKAQLAEARKRKEMKRIERKMAAVAREKAWAERLIELQQLEEAKKAAMS
ncbi:uncharacterized protein LOC109720281 [Ananas comosus]|uniref:Uncharacterized protein LOC109720281 n=1 Tax=Ananas comosus TaxID=4615 RepID=A0A199UZI0_ANACO|nr:uncharacterized protein LOC109720281 [Ananas comosus]OAY70199.1 hypothetical protein ACMD2_22683 [Ananas comosus]